MKQSLYYLFISGLILGSGPCIGFCAPILAGFIAAYKPSFKKAFAAYFSFSFAKLFSYMLLGGACGIFSEILKSGLFIGYLRFMNLALGLFVLFIGIVTLILKDSQKSKVCSFLSKGNLKNASLLGFLAGFSPCLPLLGILNYIIIISHSAMQGALYAFVFGLGTIISPVILLAGLSGKLAEFFSFNPKVTWAIRAISGFTLILLGLMIIGQINREVYPLTLN